MNPNDDLCRKCGRHLKTVGRNHYCVPLPGFVPPMANRVDPIVDVANTEDVDDEDAAPDPDARESTIDRKSVV